MLRAVTSVPRILSCLRTGLPISITNYTPARVRGNSPDSVFITVVHGVRLCAQNWCDKEDVNSQMQTYN